MTNQFQKGWHYTPLPPGQIGLKVNCEIAFSYSYIHIFIFHSIKRQLFIVVKIPTLNTANIV